MFALLISRIHSAENWIRSIFRSRYEFWKVFVVSFFGLFLLSSLGWWFMRMLAYITSVPTVGNLLMQKLLEIAFLSSFSLIALSAMVTSLSTHFSSKDLNFLLATPLSPKKIFFVKTIEASLHASWMVFLVLIPFLGSYMRIKGLGIGFPVAAFIFFIPFAFSASMVGILISAIFAAIFPKRRLTEFLSVLGICIFVALYSGIRLTLPRKLMRPDELAEMMEYLLYLQSPAASFLPSRWYVGVLNAYMAADWLRLGVCCLILMGFCALGVALLYILISKFFTRDKWLIALEQGGSIGAKAKGAQALEDQHAESARSQKSLWRVLLEKEVKYFFRDSQRFSNASFILAICMIYLVSIYRLPMDTPYLKNFISFINLALGLFIIAALSLRFCFPQPSLELPYAWVLRASPMKPVDFLGSKLIFNFLFLNLLGMILVILSPILLGTDLALIPIYMASAFFLSTVLSVVSLAVGSAFPKANVEHIVQIETSFGGFFYATCALIYVGITLAVFAWPIRYYFTVNYLNRPMGGGDWAWLGVLLLVYSIVCLVTIIISWYSAKRSFNKWGEITT
ncbi:hypothetical protein ACFL6Y_03395 [Elusimicrobiota bacterium]